MRNYSGDCGNFVDLEELRKLYLSVECPDNGYSKRASDEVRNAVKVIADNLNHGSAQKVAKAMFYEVSRSHRTLQGLFFNAFKHLCDIYKDAAWDARNRAAVQFAEKISEMDQYIPLI